MELNVASITEAVAAAHPDRDCLVFRDRRLTWADVRDRTRRLATVLHDAGLGVRAPFGSGDRWDSVHDHVALYLHNGNEYLEGMVGAWKARGAPFNVNYRYVAEELRYLLDDAATAAIVVHECFTPTLAEVLPTLARPPAVVLQVADGSGHGLLPGAVDYEAALAAVAPAGAEVVLPAELVDGWSGDDLYLCYTAGTTGMPKGAMWRQEDFLVAALGVRRRDGSDFTSMDEIVEAADRSTLRALPAPPLMHGAAHWNALSCWIAGGTVIIQDHPEHLDPDDLLRTVERHRATSLLVVGDPVARPLADALATARAEGRSPDLSSLRHLLSGGAVLSPALKAELLYLVPGLTIVDVLGSTESGRQGVSNVRAGDDAAKGFAPSSTAVVLDEAKVRRLDPGDPEVGWLAQSGRVPLGYLGDPVKTAATFPEVDGVRYAVAGDRARLRADGTIELHGRDSVCINTGGEKVFAEEVETALKTHPAVFDAVVCGRPSARWGQEVVALVHLRDGAEVSDEELRGTAAEHLARYKLPKAVVRLPALVRSPSGKADYRWAQAVAAEHAR
ncbi:AMP-binding protein [Dermatobacter hominis]|uniref:AMP-binding protein n=1 Tax=Dermatobacter hominis TaxID=2884263 RepID=UPI001D11DFA9|nr:AMP-binding protein [Dermatobacter hominis]UDY36453.1 AMP-binding protein [Dermatobacter hominis]